ncbi:phosphoglycerate dehydrogenase [Nicoliella spurrieriana]|uniref:D-3-phosphoglycerate dehydrogenase n=1 Tax=Nicoliella spurrieriana TaxID=2925830 RepID=A0A976RSW0_9LACO|nr:phosphoglycerate dehydrogenase [Nicoliella spurrieriana]UQS87220.1 phosphoglycerate dehydrogenase [Nicoliella spurrieriana]
MYNVKTYNAISPAGIDHLSNQYQVNKTDDADAYLIRSVDLHEADFPKQLKVIARAGAGFNNIPLDRVTEAGIAAFNTPGSNANAVKELVIAMLVASARHMFAVTNFSAQHIHADISLMKKTDDRFKGTELLGKKLAVIGLGHVGSLVANAARELGMKVVGFDPFLSSDAAWHISNQIERADSMKAAIKDADFVTVHVPKTAETTGLIGAEEIKAMKDGVHLLNYSRLGIVDNQAAVNALDAKHVASYITDFGEDVLFNREDVVVTPHIGGSTEEAEANGSIRGANIIMKYLETGNVKGALNLPDLNVPFNTPFRLTLIHQNIPNMVGQIATKLANNDLNIEGMSNAAKDKIAYTIIDLDEEPTEDLVDALTQINSIIRVRVIKNQK